MEAAEVGKNPSSFLENLHKLLVEEGECNTCKFINICYGYFKWPQKEYSCENVKALLKTVKEAADELRRDLATYHRPLGENRP